jgi:hypothetical protein
MFTRTGVFMFDPSFEVLPLYPTRTVRYTPERAAQVLKDQNLKNRPKKPWKIRVMARAMKAGKFTPTHQGMAFSVSGRLLDGQNRLLAIVASGVTLDIPTTYGLPDRAQADMDTGSGRTKAESLKFGYGRQVDDKVVATVNAMVGLGLQVDQLPDEIADFLDSYVESIEFAHKHATKPMQAGVRAVIARAYYTVDHAQLVEFCRIALGGHFAPGQTAAAAFGRRMITHEKVGRVKPRDWFPLTTRALLCFLVGEDREQIKPLYGNFFPLTGEKADELPPELRPKVAAAAEPEPAPVIEEHEFAGV